MGHILLVMHSLLQTAGMVWVPACVIWPKSCGLRHGASPPACVCGRTCSKHSSPPRESRDVRCCIRCLSLQWCRLGPVSKCLHGFVLCLVVSLLSLSLM